MTALSDDERLDLEALLPFYAAGVASREEMQRIDRALALDAGLRASLAEVREDQEAALRVNEAIRPPSGRAFAQFQAALAREAPARAPARGPGLIGWLAEALGGLAPRRLAYGGLAALALILVQAGAVTTLLVREPGAAFETASAGEAAAGAGSMVLVAFDPAATHDAVLRFLEKHDATIAAGPQAGGLFRLRLGAAVTSDADRETRIAAMRQERGVVRLVLPAR